jgi:hypothetical protein
MSFCSDSPASSLHCKVFPTCNLAEIKAIKGEMKAFEGNLLACVADMKIKIKEV